MLSARTLRSAFAPAACCSEPHGCAVLTGVLCAQFDRINTITRERNRVSAENKAHAKAVFEHKWFGGEPPAAPGGGAHH
jgi:hypothetical protein